MDINIKEEGQFKYIETGSSQSDTILLLHGLFGALSNFKGIINTFGEKYNIIVPILPIYDLPLKQSGLGGLLKYINEFVAYKELSNLHVLGNSLGGHLAQLFTLGAPEKVNSLILTGSSGLFESAMGGSYPKRGDYEYIKKKAEDTFYDPKVASKELIDELYDTVNDRSKALKVVVTAKSAVRHNLSDKLDKIKVPTLLVWGRQDQVTPLFVGEKFHELIPHSKFEIVEECGHAPMMEKPDDFNKILSRFLQDI